MNEAHYRLRNPKLPDPNDLLKTWTDQEVIRSFVKFEYVHNESLEQQRTIYQNIGEWNCMGGKFRTYIEGVERKYRSELVLKPVQQPIYRSWCELRCGLVLTITSGNDTFYGKVTQTVLDRRGTRLWVVFCGTPEDRARMPLYGDSKYTIKIEDDKQVLKNYDEEMGSFGPYQEVENGVFPLQYSRVPHQMGYNFFCDQKKFHEELGAEFQERCRKIVETKKDHGLKTVKNYCLVRKLQYDEYKMPLSVVSRYVRVPEIEPPRSIDSNIMLGRVPDLELNFQHESVWTSTLAEVFSKSSVLPPGHAFVCIGLPPYHFFVKDKVTEDTKELGYCPLKRFGTKSQKPDEIPFDVDEFAKAILATADKKQTEEVERNHPGRTSSLYKTSVVSRKPKPKEANIKVKIDHLKPEGANVKVEIDKPKPKEAKAHVEMDQPKPAGANIKVEIDQPKPENASIKLVIAQPKPEGANIKVEMDQPKPEKANIKVKIDHLKPEGANVKVEIDKPKPKEAKAHVEMDQPKPEEAKTHVEIDKPKSENASIKVETIQPKPEDSKTQVKIDQPKPKEAKTHVEVDKPKPKNANIKVETVQPKPEDANIKGEIDDTIQMPLRPVVKNRVTINDTVSYSDDPSGSAPTTVRKPGPLKSCLKATVPFFSAIALPSTHSTSGTETPVPSPESPTDVVHSSPITSSKSGLDLFPQLNMHTPHSEPNVPTTDVVEFFPIMPPSPERFQQPENPSATQPLLENVSAKTTGVTDQGLRDIRSLHLRSELTLMIDEIGRMSFANYADLTEEVWSIIIGMAITTALRMEYPCSVHLKRVEKVKLIEEIESWSLDQFHAYVSDIVQQKFADKNDVRMMQENEFMDAIERVFECAKRKSEEIRNALSRKRGHQQSQDDATSKKHKPTC